MAPTTRSRLHSPDPRARKRAPRSVPRFAATSHGAPPEKTLADELREAAVLLDVEHPAVAERLRTRAAKLEGGASLEDLAAAGDGGAALMLDHQRASRAGQAAVCAAPARSV